MIALSRRALLSAALGAGVLGASGLTGVLPGRSRLARAVDDVLPVDGPARTAGPIRRGRFVSATRRGADVGWLVAYPPVDAVRSGPRLPVVVALHGLGGDENGVLGLDLPGYLADVVGDPFVDAARDFAAGLSPAPAGSFGIGGHDGRYWRWVAPAQLSFPGRALVTT